ncbi:hypothetical protein L218DRAFT_886165, partial [Marasmius fiardii PR-910]
LKEKTSHLQVQIWTDVPSMTEGLALQTGGFQLCFEEAVPPNPVIWTGTIHLMNFD